jgi:hypothetical protein
MSNLDNEIDNILLKTFNQKNITEYTEFNLKKNVDINSYTMKKLLTDLNNKSNVKAYYNYKTYNCDSIGILDHEGCRIIDFNDSYYDLMNKGLDFMTLGVNLIGE